MIDDDQLLVDALSVSPVLDVAAEDVLHFLAIQRVRGTMTDRERVHGDRRLQGRATVHARHLRG